MNIETTSDLAESLADQLGIHGAHVEGLCTEDRCCRVCFVGDLRVRMTAAVRNDEALAKAGIVGGAS